MLALFVASIMLLVDAHRFRGALCLGLSAAAKLVPFAAAPWVVLEETRSLRGRDLAASLAIMSALVAAPIIVCFIPFWDGPRTLVGLQGTAAVALSAPGAHHASWPVLVKLENAAAMFWPGLLLYAALTIWQVMRPARVLWLAAWSILVLSPVFWYAGIWFPWYLAWAWMPALLRWNRLHVGLSAVIFSFSLIWFLS
jgi:hypothetical protein